MTFQSISLNTLRTGRIPVIRKMAPVMRAASVLHFGRTIMTAYIATNRIMAAVFNSNSPVVYVPCTRISVFRTPDAINCSQVQHSLYTFCLYSIAIR